MIPASANPIDALLAMVDIIGAHDANLAGVLRGALVLHIRDGVPLDKSLGLSGRLGRAPRTEWKLRARNSYLLNALAALEGDYDRLAEEVRHYLNRIPDYQRERTNAPSDWPDWRRLIHAAAQINSGLPDTQRGLRKALTNMGTVPPPVQYLGGMKDWATLFTRKNTL